MQVKVSLNNCARELDSFTVRATATSASQALIEKLMDDWSLLSEGDSITITEVEQPRSRIVTNRSPKAIDRQRRLDRSEPEQRAYAATLRAKDHR